MSFGMREFTKKGILDSIGKVPDYKVAENMEKWFEKGVLQQEDVTDILIAVSRHNDENAIVGDMVK